MSILFVIAWFGTALGRTGCYAIVLEGFARLVGCKRGDREFCGSCLLLKSCHHLSPCLLRSSGHWGFFGGWCCLSPTISFHVWAVTSIRSDFCGTGSNANSVTGFTWLTFKIHMSWLQVDSPAPLFSVWGCSFKWKRVFWCFFKCVCVSYEEQEVYV